MDSLIGIGVMGTFGQPSKYQQAFYFDVNFHKNLDVRVHGLKPGPDTVLFAVRKEIVNGVLSLCFCQYTYTEELNISGDFFIGSCIVLQGGSTSGQNIYRLLVELNDNMVGNPLNVYYSVIRANNAAAVIVREPMDYLAVRMNTKPGAETRYTGKAIDDNSRFLVLPGGDHSSNLDKTVIDFFDHAIMSFPGADALYLTNDEQLATDVAASGAMPVLPWEQFLYDYRPQGLALPTTKKQARVVAPSAPGTAEQHVPAPMPPGQVDAAEDVKKDTAQETMQLVADEEIEKDTPVQEATETTATAARQYIIEDEDPAERNKKVPFYKRNKAPEIWLFLILALVVLSVIFYYAGNRKTIAKATVKAADTATKVMQANVKSAADTLAATDTAKRDSVINKDSLIAALKAEIASPKPKELSPRPNMELNPPDIVKLKQAGLQYKLLSEVVRTIFDNYPDNVGSIYKNQEKEYGQKLMNLNKGCFQKIGDDYMYAHDSIAHIPAYKNKHLPDAAPR